MDKRSLLGWKEWISLPDLEISPILAKVDTGAKTCALHAFYIEDFMREDQTWIRFKVHPVQGETRIVRECEAQVRDRREVTDSGGHSELRYVIETQITVGHESFATQITLTNRDNMKYRFLLGRNALRRRFVVDPAKSFVLGKQSPEELIK